MGDDSDEYGEHGAELLRAARRSVSPEALPRGSASGYASERGGLSLLASAAASGDVALRLWRRDGIPECSPDGLLTINSEGGVSEVWCGLQPVTGMPLQPRADTPHNRR